MVSSTIKKIRCWIINTNNIFYFFLSLIDVLFDTSSGTFQSRLSLDESAQGRRVKYERKGGGGVENMNQKGIMVEQYINK